MGKVTITAVIFILLPYVITGKVADLKLSTPEDAKENVSSRIETLEHLEEVWKAASKALYTRRKGRYECPWPYQLIAGSCLHFYISTKDRFDWKAAQRYCWALDGDLVTAGDLQELVLLVGYMNVAKEGTFWIGGSRSNSTTAFQWVDGSSLPDISLPLWNYVDRSGHHCVALQETNASFKLRNLSCDSVYYRILCELLS